MNETLQRLDKKRKAVRLSMSVLGLILLVPLVLVLLGKYAPAALVLGVAALYYLALARPDARAYEAQWREDSIRSGLRELDEYAYAYRPDGAGGLFDSAALIPQAKDGKALIGRNRVDGVLGGYRTTLMDVSLPVATTAGDAGRMAVLCGCLVRLALGADTGIHARIAGCGMVDVGVFDEYYGSLGLARVSTRVPMPELVACYQRDTAGPDIASALVAQVTALWEGLGGGFILSIDGDTLCALLPRRTLKRPAPALNEPIAGDALDARALPELDILLEIAGGLAR